MNFALRNKHKFNKSLSNILFYMNITLSKKSKLILAELYRQYIHTLFSIYARIVNLDFYKLLHKFIFKTIVDKKYTLFTIESIEKKHVNHIETGIINVFT